MSTEQNDVIDIRDIFGVLRRQVRVLVISAALILGVAFIYVLNATPIYTATTLVYVDPSEKDLLDSASGAQLNSSSESSKIESEVLILRSPRIAIETINRANLLSSEDYKPTLGLVSKIKLAVGLNVETVTDGGELLSRAIAKLNSDTSVRRQGLTYLVSVSADSKDPQLAAGIANTMAGAYIDLQVQSKSAAVLASRDVIEAQISSARTSLAQTEASLDTFIENNLARLGEEVGTDEFNALSEAFQTARDDFSASQDALSQARVSLERGAIDDVVAQLESDALNALAQQRRQLLVRLGSVEQGSEQAVDLRSSLTQLEENLQAEAELSLGRLEAQVASVNQSQEELMQQIRSEVIGSRLSADTLAEIYTLQQESDIAQRQYSTLISRLRDLEAQSLVQVADSRIVSEALPPRTPSRPNKKLVLALAGVIALGLGVGLAFLNEFFVGGVTSRKQLENLVPAQVGAIVPKTEVSDTQLGVADLVSDSQLSTFSESIRRLRAAIDHPSRKSKGKCSVVMVTSSIAAEGKSSISLALARTYALAGKKVLLIDGDLRKPMLHKLVGFQPERGFLDYLKEPRALDDEDGGFYISDPKSDAGIILGSGRADIPTDQLLQSVAFEKLIEESRDVMDVVIVDTSPLGPVVDARYIAPIADAVVHVVRYGVTQQKNLRESFSDLSSSVREGTPIYTVLNLDEVETRGYGYYSGYSY